MLTTYLTSVLICKNILNNNVKGIGMKVAKKIVNEICLFSIFLTPIFYSQYANAKDINLLCSFKSFCEERLPSSCETSSAKNFESVQHVKISDKSVVYWGDTFEVTKINTSVVEARRLEKYPKYDSLNESLLILNRYTGIMDLTHTLQKIPKEFEKNNVIQINRVRYACIESAPKF